jgi:hypothetical protein
VKIREIGRMPPKKRTRQPPAVAMTHAINHWIRVEVIAILQEGVYSAGEVAEMLDLDVKPVTGHIHDLYESGCIEFAGTKMVDGTARPVYRAISLPEVTPETYRTMSIEDRHELNGAVTQGVLSETISSYRNGKMDDDEDLYLVWDAAHLDAQGEREMHDNLAACFKRAKKIHARSVNRMAKSGENGQTKIVGLLGFRRGRQGRPAGGSYRSENSDW